MLADRSGSAETTSIQPGHPDGSAPPQEAPTRYAGVVTRTIALVADVLLIDAVALAVAGAVALIFAVFAVTGRNHTLTAIIGGAAFVAWLVGYFVTFWTTTGQTPGSRMMRIRVLRTDGGRLRPIQALIRLGAMVLSLPLFWGYWPILTSPRRRGVPDAMAGSVVVVDDDIGQAEPAGTRPQR
ncbi:MAG TPA: RDD family protein [Solirubrobacteraceae bacterium]|nr:RDD family protein [Solirubrobacteraceae bacterium]